jgi:FkbM family methyltransferase
MVETSSCKHVEELGKSPDNWALCITDLPLPCRIFSFGVGFDYSFDLESTNLGCEVWMFDPTPKVIKSLSSKQMNNRRIHFYPWGLANKTEEVLMKANHWNKKVPSVVQMYSFHDILKMFNASAPQIVKVDIEGYEFDVIEDIVSYKAVKQLLLELHFGGIRNNDFKERIVDDGGERWIRLITFLQKQGFSIFWKLEGRYAKRSEQCYLDGTSEECYQECARDPFCYGALQEYALIRRT